MEHLQDVFLFVGYRIDVAAAINNPMNMPQLDLNP